MQTVYTVTIDDRPDSVFTTIDDALDECNAIVNMHLHAAMKAAVDEMTVDGASVVHLKLPRVCVIQFYVRGS